MNYNKIFENFIEKVKERGTYASKEELKEIASTMLDVIIKNEDATPEDLVEKVIANDIDEMKRLKDEYLLPGYTMGITVGNINVKYFGGDIDSFSNEMKSDAMFDIASMTKMYTQVILYNLIKEGKIKLDDKVSDLDPRFTNLNDVSIKELTEFTVEFQTPGNITTMENLENAKDALYNIKIAEYPDGNLKRGNYYYTDFGMMILKEVMESITNKKYTELVDEYITSKLGLENTQIIIPENKIDLLTGSANSHLGAINDPKALAVGGYSGHAGIFASSDDLIKFGQGIENGQILPKEYLHLARTQGFKANRGLMGNTYVATPQGLDNSYVETFSENTDFVIQGSTRTQLNVGHNAISTILLNPSSLSIEKAKEEERRINEIRAIEGKPPVSIVKHFKYNRDGQLVEFASIDARQTLNYRQVDPLTTMNAKTALRLEFLSEVIKEYDKNYQEQINVNKHI